MTMMLMSLPHLDFVMLCPVEQRLPQCTSRPGDSDRERDYDDNYNDHEFGLDLDVIVLFRW